MACIYTFNGKQYSEEEFNQFLQKNYFNQPKTRVLYELQSDLFQKGRDKKDLITKFPDKNTVRSLEEYNEQYSKIGSKTKSNENQFLQLLNNNNNWVTFFVKSIIQDSAKKGYEKVLFPSGNTASKVEGHTTLEEFKKQKEDRIKELEKTNFGLKDKNTQRIPTQLTEGFGEYVINKFKTKEEADNFRKKNNAYYYDILDNINEIEINQLKQELERVETEGFGALKPIYNFYENTVSNILKKNYKINQITDEYGNTWNEVILDEIRDTKSINFSQGLEHQKKIVNKAIDFSPNRQYSFREITLLRKRIGDYNKKYNVKHYFETPKQVGQADLYTTDIIINHGRPENPELKFMYFDTGRTASTEDVLDKITEFGSKQGIKELAQDLLKVIPDDVKVVPITLAHMQESGVYTSDKHQIKSNWSLNKEDFEKNVLHEVSHALTVHEYEANPEFKKNIDALWNQAKKILDKEKFAYELSTGKEFISGAFSNNEFVNELAKAKGINENAPSLMIQFINLIKKFLGINHVSLLDNLFYEVENVNNYKSDRNQTFRQGGLFEDYNYDDLDNYAPLTEEDVSNAKLDKLLNQSIRSLEDRRTELSSQYGTERVETGQRIKNINTSIKRLVEDRTYDALVAIMDKDLDEADKVLHKDYDEMSFFDLMEAKRILVYSKDFDSLLASEEIEPDVKRRLQNIRDKNNTLTVKMNKLVTSKIQEASKLFGKEITIENLEKSYVDISSFKKLGLDMSTSEIPHLALAEKILNYRSRKTAEELLQYNNEKKNLENKFGTEAFKKIFDAGRLITPFLNELFVKEREMLSKLKTISFDENSTQAEKNDAKKELHDWYKDNYDYKLTDQGKALYESELKQIIEANTFYDNNGNPEINQVEIDKWVHENSWDSMGTIDSNGNIEFKRSYPGAKTIGDETVYANKWYSYLNKTPKEKWNNPKYEQVKDLEVYKWYVEKVKYILHSIPHQRLVDLGMYDKFLNQVTIDLTENKFNLENTWKGVKHSVLDWFTVGINKHQAQGKDIKLTDEKGREKPLIRISSLKKLQEELVSKSPTELLDKMYDMAVSYEHKLEVQPMLDLIQYKVDNLSALQQNKFGALLNKVQTDPIEVANGLIKAQEMLRYNIKVGMTGQRRTDPKLSSDVTEHELALLESGEKLEIRKFSGVNTLDSIIDFTRLNLIGLKPFTALANIIIGISNNYMWAARKTDFSEKDLDWAITKMFGNMWKFWSSLGGQTNVLNKTVPKEAEKIINLMVKFGIVPESLLEDRTEYSSTSKVINKYVEIMYKMQEGGENIIAGQLLLAKMKNTFLEDLKGKKRNLYEAYNPDGTWNIKEFGNKPEWESLRTLNEEGLNTSKLQAFRDSLDQVRYNTQGNYSSPMMFKATVMNRVLAMFRTWLPRAIHNRFGKYNPELEFKGRYTTVGTAFKNKIGLKTILGGSLIALAKLSNIPILGKYIGSNPLVKGLEGRYESFMTENGLTELDIQNMRVNIQELHFILMSVLMVAALKGLKGDDDDDKELNLLINLGTRTYQDLSFFLLPTSTLNIIKNPIPVSPSIINAIDIIVAGSNYISNPEDDIYKRGIHKGDSKFAKEVQDLLPFYSSWNATEATMSQIFGEQSYKYNK